MVKSTGCPRCTVETNAGRLAITRVRQNGCAMSCDVSGCTDRCPGAPCGIAYALASDRLYAHLAAVSLRCHLELPRYCVLGDHVRSEPARPGALQLALTPARPRAGRRGRRGRAGAARDRSLRAGERRVEPRVRAAPAICRARAAAPVAARTPPARRSGHWRSERRLRTAAHVFRARDRRAAVGLGFGR